MHRLGTEIAHAIEDDQVVQLTAPFQLKTQANLVSEIGSNSHVKDIGGGVLDRSAWLARIPTMQLCRRARREE